MKKDFFEIILILDESGSMNSCKSDTIGGVNEFIDTQKRIQGEVNVTLVKFSDYYQVVNEGIPLEKVEYLNERNYTPSNTTALLDAVGRTIHSVGLRLSNTPEERKPEKVIVAIITDGHENASVEFSRMEIFDMVTHQRKKYNWEFVFLGADIDSWGAEIGITHNVNIRKEEMSKSFKGLSHFLLQSRISKFFDDPESSFDLSEDELNRNINKLCDDNDKKE